MLAKVCESDGDFVQKQPHNCKRCMNHPCKFQCYGNYIFWEKKLEALLSYGPLYNTKIMGTWKGNNISVHKILKKVSTHILKSTRLQMPDMVP
jgi:hypothetical protein